MFFAWLKRYMPRSLYARAALILLLPVVGLQLVVSIVFIQRHFDGVTRQLTEGMALEIAMLVTEADRTPTATEAAARVSELAGQLEIRAVFGDPLPDRNRRPLYDLSGIRVIEVLRDRVPELAMVDLRSDPLSVITGAETRHGPLALTFSRKRVSAANPHQLLVLMVGAGLIMSLVAIIFLRNQMRPIKRLAVAAEAFGKGQVVPFRPSGANEVRAAGTAFLEMRSRIDRMLEQRTMMLSGVSHDLRTPLTRFRLGLSMLDPDEAGPLEQDVDDMERMLDAFLAFARSDRLDDPEPTDAAALLTRLAERMGAEIGTVEGAGRKVPLRPMAVERALSNLIGNALRYGTRARVSLHYGEKSLRFTVEDDGPGIPEHLRDESLKPFVRLDPARNQDAGGGVGLGLAITQDIARRHGGSLRLGTSTDLGGLAADLVLPR